MENQIPEPVAKTAGQKNGQPELPAVLTDKESRLAPDKPRFWQRLSRRLYWGLLIVIIAGGLIFVALWAASTKKGGANSSAATALPVPVATATREDVYNEVKIEAEFRPYLEVELHAKVSGYVTNISVDFGDRVKAGQLLAELEVPELQDELHRAKAAQEKAEADYSEAHWIYTRTLAVVKEHPNLLAQQELDTAEAKDRATKAAIAAAKADVEKNQTLVAYTRIIAPFDGVITRRYADPGSLIQAGTRSDTQSMPVVRLSDNYHLRLDFPVDLPYVKEIKEGGPVEVQVESFGGKNFRGKISRFTRRVDKETRKMWTEVEVANPNLELVPGMYAKVVLRTDLHAQALTVPIEAVSGDRKPTAYVVDSSGTVEERALTLGIETPNRWEILAGLNEGDLVITGSREQVKPGQKVAAKQVGSLAQQ
jgi:RND family efflux transporter MFP subunit